ncbi:alpha/beta hydrolase [Jeotgalicoccus psychrophilus]|uniref:alpha/beta hydrolase n=1 Tax=Jeotgalicoccus psychrophilus TaxID=157228 RepID=UPI00040DF88A|nr:alpha/beta hydrolase [Jeotgalicoccus psychrophilus]
MLEIKVQDLNYEFLINIPYGDTLRVITESNEFYFKIFLKKESFELLVHSNGAINRNIKEPPVFHRSSWYDELNSNCIFIDDKTIHNTEYKAGWGIGTEKEHYIEKYSEIIKLFQQSLGIKSKNVYYWGSSAGGFMSLMLATRHIESTAIVENPQTDLRRHNKTKLRNLILNGFVEADVEKITEEHSYRFSVCDSILKYKYIPNIVYIQNTSFKPDVKKQLLPFIDDLKRNNISTEKLKIINYKDDYRGHLPLPKEDYLNMLNLAITFNRI